LFSQIRCGTVEYTEKLKTGKTLFEDKEIFEKWIREKQRQKARQDGARRTTSTFQVPVVVHVIHNGEAVGAGKNIPDAQILSQISVLNKDFNRLNADAGETPDEFLPVAGAFDIEFILAKQDPEGLPTDGIVRVPGTKTSWTITDNYTLKSLSYWPAEDYLNIWVCNLTDFLGYSQFPVSGLPGLENSSTNRLTDGVVIASNVFGSIEDGAFNLQNNYNEGRTATHELGHFFGLRHIWGDDNGACSGTDYVDDTPNQAGSTSGCPTHPRVTCTDVTSMFQNYLDYTHDECMNILTQGQADRMTTVIENSPRRASLTTSPGLSEPAPVANDLGLRSVARPNGGECSIPFTPGIEVRNYGSNAVSSAQIRIRKDGVIAETKDFTFIPPIASLNSTFIDFSAQSLASGDHNISFELLLTNGVTDGNSSNNDIGQDVTVPESILLPFQEDFTTVPSTWSILNPDQLFTWEQATTPVSGSNTAMKLEFYNYEDHEGEIDLLVTPTFDLTSAPAALLKFDVAYARFQSSNDGLRIVLLSDCNSDVSLGTVVYDKTGQTLETASPTTSEFNPTPSQWRRESVDLTAFVGQSNLQLSFIGINDWGNNLYLDNISLTTSPIHDVVLKEVVAPSPVTCANQSSPVLRIQNAGTLLSSLTVLVTVNGQVATQSFTGLSLAGNMEMDLELNPFNLANGPNNVSFELIDPNGEADFYPADNIINATRIVNKANDNLPLQQDFDGSFENSWTSINPGGGIKWEAINVNGNNALYFKAFENSSYGDEAWLVTPVIDFSEVQEASITYDLSYASMESAIDKLRIIASTDCGTTYSDTIALLSGTTLSDGRTSLSSWKPQTADDWSSQSHVLSSLIGKSDVRIAFVFTNDNGNNIYLDNLEFFVSDSPIKLTEVFSVYPNPVEHDNAVITFNLPEKGAVTVEVADAMGKILIRETLDDILNQTFPLQLSNAATGVYLVRIMASNAVYLKKIIVLK
jgi:hypothetical protein